ncbi:hypothetical protein VYU27_001084 [Nannochloropsis oceanica]
MNSMRYVLSTVLVTLFVASDAFMVPKTSRPQLFLQAKINNKVDLESPKVVTMVEMKPGEKKVFCRCWQSGTFPLCDGAHMKHNEATGDNIGPLIVSTPKPSN